MYKTIKKIPIKLYNPSGIAVTSKYIFVRDRYNRIQRIDRGSLNNLGTQVFSAVPICIMVMG